MSVDPPPRPACSLTEEGLECSCCSWVGCEAGAVYFADKLDEPYDLDDLDESYWLCPVCAEVCAHTPLDEINDELGGHCGCSVNNP